MKRVKRLMSQEDDIHVEIIIRVNGKRNLTRDEVDHVVSQLADRAMNSMNEARYIHVPLHKIVVT
jgi:hypothetical protein